MKTVDPRTTPEEIFELWSIPAFDAGSPELLRGSEIGSQKKVVSPGDVLLSRIIPHIRRGWVVRENPDGRRQIASTEWIVFSSTEVVPGFLRQLLVSDFFHASFMQTITGVGGSLSRANPGAVGEIRIPLPPLEVQKEIVVEIEGYQKVIDGARAVLDHYRPHIPIHPDWPMVEIGEVCTLLNGRAFKPTDWEKADSGGLPIVRIQNLNNPAAEFNYFTGEVSPRNIVEPGALLFSWSGSRGTSFGAHVWPGPRAVLNQHIFKVEFPPDRANKTFLLHALNGAVAEVEDNLHGGVGLVHITKGNLEHIKIPLPELPDQDAVATEIDAEQSLVNANRELITRMEKKIQATLARVWGEEAATVPAQES